MHGTDSGGNAAVQPPAEGKVKVYFFHSKKRCRGCLAIQSVSGQAVREHFGNNARVAFLEVDFTQRANRALAGKYEVAFSSLIIASDKAHTNLTNEAFAYATINPDTLTGMIVDVVNGYLD